MPQLQWIVYPELLELITRFNKYSSWHIGVAMEKTGFIYIWYDRKRKMYYIGCHLGSEDDGYVCSSNRMREAYRRRPEDFKRRILKRDIKRQHLLDEELKWLQMIKDEELRSKYYNIKNTKWDNFINKPICLKGRKLSEETKQKLREVNLGKKLSKETKIKLSEAGKNRKGEKRSEETKKRISFSKKGKIPWNRNKTYRQKGGKYEWIIEGPDGKTYIENGIDCFAKEKNICANNLRKRGKASGFTIKEKRVLR